MSNELRINTRNILYGDVKSYEVGGDVWIKMFIRKEFFKRFISQEEKYPNLEFRSFFNLI